MDNPYRRPTPAEVRRGARGSAEIIMRCACGAPAVAPAGGALRCRDCYEVYRPLTPLEDLLFREIAHIAGNRLPGERADDYVRRALRSARTTTTEGSTHE